MIIAKLEPDCIKNSFNKILTTTTTNAPGTTFIFFKDYSKVSNLPEPTYIAFEQQQVVPFFDWSLIGPTGKTKNLYIDQGNVMIIHFWDANNPKSVEELEIFQKLYDDYKTKEQFYFVTSNSQVEVRSFIEKNEFSFHVWFKMV